MARTPRETTRARILDAAQRLFLTRGFTRVTVEDIAMKAGYTRGAVYSNFSNKVEIFIALIDVRFEGQLERATHDLSVEYTAHDRVSALAGWLAGEVARSREWSVAEIEFYAHTASDPELSQRLRELHLAGRAELADFLVDQCDKLGVELTLDPQDFAVIVNSLIRGLMIEWTVDLSTDVARLFALTFGRLLDVPESQANHAAATHGDIASGGADHAD